MSTDPGSLEIDVDERSDGDREIAFVRPSGEIDLANSDRLASAVAAPAVVDRDGIVLDLTRVSFMDSSGLRVALMAAREGGDRFVTIVQPGSAVASLVDLIDVAPRLNLVASEDEALARLRASESK
jgi:anti-anti-sigma factor